MNDRTRQSTEFWGLLIVAITQLCALIWGAASISKSVDNLYTATEKLSITASRLGDRMSELETQVRILQDRASRVIP